MTAIEDSAPPVLAARTATVCVLEVDPELARCVPGGDRVLAGRALNLREVAVAPGATVDVEADDAFALLVVEGTIWREARVGEACAPQLLDAGAVILRAPTAASLLAATTTMLAIDAVRTAVLDRRFLLAAARWPELMAVVHRRLAEQQRDAATLAAIAHLPRVEDRIEFLLWHLAERWGRVCPDGVHIDLRLTHASLGRFVGARRPTVSLALAQLRDRGVLQRTAKGAWVLLGSPPSVPAADDCAPPSIL